MSTEISFWACMIVIFFRCQLFFAVNFFSLSTFFAVIFNNKTLAAESGFWWWVFCASLSLWKMDNKCKMWKFSHKQGNRFRGIEGCCLRKLLQIWYELRIRKMEITQRTGINTISDEVKKEWKWLRHVSEYRKGILILPSNRTLQQRRQERQ